MHSQGQGINRVIDANINRLKEGLRVCEEIARFIIQSPSLSMRFKTARHDVDLIFRNISKYSRLTLINDRDSLRDVGKKTFRKELDRKCVRDILFANMQRAKESTRVLEEFSKLNNKNIALKFKKIRYDLYEIEKRTLKEISSLFNHR